MKSQDITHLRFMPYARAAFEESIALKKQILESDLLINLVCMAEKIADALAMGGKLLLCGNGGSAADAQHLACELLIRLRSEVNRESLPAISLATDTSTITACSNDYEFDFLYERMVTALGRPGDVLLALTTSGQSINVIRALRKARELNLLTLGFLGNDGGKAKMDCDLSFIVPAKESCRVQEIHITAGHILMDLIEQSMLASGHIKISNKS
jgi:D-sedoheptulose 7-phosphate isomerase